MTPKPPTIQHCPVCKAGRRLVDFRRWNGRHRTLHAVCNICDPPTSIFKMNPDQRDRALAKGVSTVREHRLREYDERIKRQGHMQISVKAHARLNQSRRRNWMALILTPLREEHRWARRHAKRLKESQHDLSNWERFFTLYAETLGRMRRRAHDKLVATTLKKPDDVASIVPTLAQTIPLTYLQADEWAWLKMAYIECERARKGRGYRDPWMIFWETSVK